MVTFSSILITYKQKKIKEGRKKRVTGAGGLFRNILKYADHVYIHTYKKREKLKILKNKIDTSS